MYGYDILCGISKGTFEICTPAVVHPYVLSLLMKYFPLNTSIRKVVPN